MPQALTNRDNFKYSQFLSFSPLTQLPKDLCLNPWVGVGRAFWITKKGGAVSTQTLFETLRVQSCIVLRARHRMTKGPRGVCTWALGVAWLEYCELWHLGSSCPSVVPLFWQWSPALLILESQQEEMASLVTRRGIQSFGSHGKWCPYPQVGAEAASSVSCIGWHNTMDLLCRGGKLIFPLPFGRFLAETPVIKD